MSISRFVVNNTAAPPAPSPVLNVFHAVSFSINKKAKTRFEMLNGRQHLVVPMVMLVEGVHAGSGGPLYYPGDELGKTPVVWNMKPVVVYHPTFNNQPISACDPEVLNKRMVGVIMNAHYEGTKLHAEAWIEVSVADAVDDRIMKALNANQKIEISTGLFTDSDEIPGVWNGKSYTATVRNFRPDHLAILPDQIGACSIADGAGLLANEVSHDAVRDLIRATLCSVPDYCYIMDVFGKFFVFEKDGKTFRQNYTATDTTATLVGEPEAVVRVVQYRLSDGTIIGNKEWDLVNKTQMVEKLIGNGTWVEGDREFLMKQDEARLQGFLGNAKKEEMMTEEEKKKAKKMMDAPVGNTDTAPVAAPVPVKEQTAADYIASAPPAMRSMLANGLRAHEAEKARVIAVILGNSRNKFTKEQLNSKELDELQAIESFCEPVSNGAATYGALADAFAPRPTGNSQKNDEEVLGLPVMNFGVVK